MNRTHRLFPVLFALLLLGSACGRAVSSPPYGVYDSWENRPWGSPFGYGDPRYDPFGYRDPFYDPDFDDPFYGSGGGFARRRHGHDRFHQRLERSHREGHESLRQQHRDAHRRPMTKDEHRAFHRELRGKHQGLHEGLRSGHRSGHDHH